MLFEYGTGPIKGFAVTLIVGLCISMITAIYALVGGIIESVFLRPVYRREDLAPGAAFAGPAIVEQLDSTTVVEPGDTVRVDPLGNLDIAVAPATGA